MNQPAEDMASPAQPQPNQEALHSFTTQALMSGIVNAGKTGVATLTSSPSMVNQAWEKGIKDPLVRDNVRKVYAKLIPKFTPDFFDETTQPSEYRDSETRSFAPPLNPEINQIPKRMFNLHNQRLEDVRIPWDKSFGQYCILSHCWKGNEIDYGYLQNTTTGLKMYEKYDNIAKSHPNQDIRNFAKAQRLEYEHLHPRFNDVQLLRAQIIRDVDEQLHKIEPTLGEFEEKRQLKGADEARDYGSDEAKQLKGNEGLRQRAFKAFEKFKDDQKSIDSTDYEPGSLAYLLNQLEPMLDRVLSLHKLEGALQEAKRILTHDYFAIDPDIESTKKLYLWTDPICINKGDANELNESLARMGEWYSNAECCLVQVDTKDSEWKKAFDDAKMPHINDVENEVERSIMSGTTKPTDLKAGQTPESIPNYTSFEHLCNLGAPSDEEKELGDKNNSTSVRPKWATRAWTLQELVLPKVTFFSNSLWEPLDRPVLELGTYYYLVGYIDKQLPGQELYETYGHVFKSIEKEEIWNSVAELCKEPATDPDRLISNISPLVEKPKRIIRLLNFLGVHMPRNMDDDTAGVYIQGAISEAAKSIVEVVQGNKNSVDNDQTSDANTKRKKRRQARMAMVPNLKDKIMDIMQTFSFGTEPTASPPQLEENIETFIIILLRALAKQSLSLVWEDKHNMTKFSSVRASECCRGLQRAKCSAFEILNLAAYREATVPTDRVYSLMGTVGVQISVFHPEGLTKALSRLLDQVIMTSNDVSIFNWAGKDFGSPLRGRSLYPSRLEAYDPAKNESAQVDQRFYEEQRSRRQQSKQNKFQLKIASENLERLCDDFKAFMGEKQDWWGWRTKDVKKWMDLVRGTSLKELAANMQGVAKILGHLRTAPADEKKPVQNERPKEPASAASKEAPTSQTWSSPTDLKSVGATMKSIQTSAVNIKAPSLGRFGRFASGKKSTATEATEPSTAVEEPAVTEATQPPVVEEARSATPASGDTGTDSDAIISWIRGTDPNLSKPPSDVQDALDKMNDHTLKNSALPPESSEDFGDTLEVDRYISPNPIMVTTSGIEGVFDVQRIIMEVETSSENDKLSEYDRLRAEVRKAMKYDKRQKISGKCTISTGIASLKLEFCCTAEQLEKQLDVCDITKRTVLNEDLVSSEQTSPDATENNQTDRKGELITRMLEYVEESDLDMIAGEWALVRFSAAPGAKWFLCLVELGSTHQYVGRRIATDDINFDIVSPESRLIAQWEAYMNSKKNELIDRVELLMTSKQFGGLTSQRLKQGEESESVEGQSKPLDVSSDEEDATETFKEMRESLGRIGVGAAWNAAQAVTQRLGDKLEDRLGLTLLSKWPKRLRLAIINLNENDHLLPAMFISEVQIHMF